jgi:hypothetical protein
VEVRWEIDDHGGYEEESPGPWRVLSFHPPGVTVEEVETWYTLRGPERYDREPGSPGREARVRVRVEEEYVTEREYGRWSEAAGARKRFQETATRPTSRGNPRPKATSSR